MVGKIKSILTDKKIIKILIVVFLGPFGVHKFMNKEYKMGFIYLFTCGLFMFGWLYDIIKEVYRYFKPKNYDSIMTKEIIDKIHAGELTNINVDTINLRKDECCYYVDRGQTYKEKTITTGYTGKSAGMSFRVMKGVSYRTGGSGSKAVRETQRTTYNGILYITNERVVYSSIDESFDKPIEKVTSVIEIDGGLLIQIGSRTIEILTNTNREFILVFNLVK